METAVQTETTVTEWADQGHVLHRVTGDHYVLYSPESGRDVDPCWLAGHGVDASWWCEFGTVGDVTVTVLRRVQPGIPKDLVDFVEPRWT